MAAIQFTRFETVFPNRESLVNNLNLKSRLVAEGVCGCYYNLLGEVEVLLVVFKSSVMGDYEIVFDSSSDSVYHKIRSIDRPSRDTTDYECIELAMNGIQPIQYDIVIIEEIDNYKVSYQYSDGIWYLLYKRPGASEIIGVTSTDTVKLEIIPSIVQGGPSILSANVKLDDESLIFDSQFDVIRVNKVNGGTF